MKGSEVFMFGAAAALGYAAYKYSKGEPIIPGTGPCSASSMPSWLMGCTATAAPPPAQKPAEPTGPTVPPLGTKIVSLPQAVAQMKAKDAYILPSLDLYVLLQTQIPEKSGYQFYVDADGVPLLLRQDVYDAVLATAAGAAGSVALATIKQMMVTAGLSGGLGDFRRHMYTRTGRA